MNAFRKALDPLTDEERAAIIKRLQSARDILEATLIGILYVDYWIDVLVKRRVKRPEFVLERFQYLSQKSDILHAFGVFRPEDIYTRLRALNAIRNDLVHKIKPKDLDKRIMALPVKDIYGFGANTSFESDPKARIILEVTNLVIQISNLATNPPRWRLKGK
jgi:hypothetical protein